MPLLKHQIVIHPDLIGHFTLDQPPTPYQQRSGFAWYLCPVTIAEEQGWLLVNVATRTTSASA